MWFSSLDTDRASLRGIAEYISCGEDDSLPSPEHTRLNTKKELEASEQAFQEWYDRATAGLPRAKADKISDVIYAFMHNIRQDALEKGFRAGARLMIDVMRSEGGTLDEA